jgi:uncharacterized protein
MKTQRKKVIYFHGLESEQGGEKVDFLTQKYFTIAPAMDYHNPNLFQEMLELVQDVEPDLLIGSSMGGYFAYMIASHTGIPVVLLNPALHSRSFEPEGVIQGEKEVVGVMINGSEDDVIDPTKTANILRKSIMKGQLRYYLRDHGHRTPLKIFEDYL